MMAQPHFPPSLVFLFTLCSDGRCNYQSQEEAAMVYSLWKPAGSSKPVGREINTDQLSAASSSNGQKLIKHEKKSKSMHTD